MGLFALNVAPDLPILPVCGKLPGTSLMGFTDTRVPFGNSSGGLSDNSGFTFDANSLIVMRSLGINTTAPSKQLEINSASGQCMRLTYNDNNGNPSNYTDFLLNATGQMTVNSTGSLVTFSNITHCDDKIEYTSTTEYIDQETW